MEHDEITLREIILKGAGYYKFIKTKFKVIAIISLLSAGILIRYAWVSKPEYVGDLSFVLEEEGKSNLGGYASLASQFGINIGGGSSASGIFSGDNLIELLKSRNMIEQTLLTPVVLKDKSQRLLVNYYIDINQLHKDWESNEKLKAFYFKENKDRSQFSVAEDSLLGVFYQDLSKKTKIEKRDKKLSIIDVEVTDNDEYFAKIFTETLVSTAVKLYKNTKTNKLQAAIGYLQHRTDSVRTFLEQKQDALARLRDENIGISKAEARTGLERKQREVTMLEGIYTELFKNLELNKTSLIKETPVIQVIDHPILPLTKHKKSKRNYALIGFVMGALLSTIYFLIKEYFYKQYWLEIKKDLN